MQIKGTSILERGDSSGKDGTQTFLFAYILMVFPSPPPSQGKRRDAICASTAGKCVGL